LSLGGGAWKAKCLEGRGAERIWRGIGRKFSPALLRVGKGSRQGEKCLSYEKERISKKKLRRENQKGWRKKKMTQGKVAETGSPGAPGPKGGKKEKQSSRAKKKKTEGTHKRNNFTKKTSEEKKDETALLHGKYKGYGSKRNSHSEEKSRPADNVGFDTTPRPPQRIRNAH